MKKLNLLTLVLLTFLLISSCSKNQNESISPATSNLETSKKDVGTNENDRFIKLGKKLENPYTLKVMNDVVKKLNSPEITNSVKVRITNKYVRFLPKNEEEFADLLKLKDLEIFNYPMDYEIIQRGNKFKDSSLVDAKYNWYYTVVPEDYKMPKIKAEILSDLYMPENDEFLKGKEGLIKSIEDEAFKLTKNYISTKNGKIASWNPQGHIEMWDNSKCSYVPIKGCKIRTRRLLSVKTTLTDNNGNYIQPHAYSNPVHYDIIWTRADFDILDNDFDVAIFDGPESSSNWNVSLISGRNAGFAVIHRAAFEYYYNRTGDAYGLYMPPYTRISYENSSNSIAGLTLQYNPGGIKLKIWTNVAESAGPPYRERSNFETFGTVVHEIGHASHFNIQPGSFNPSSNLKATESWGQACKWYFSKREYGKFGNVKQVYSGVYNTMIASPYHYCDADAFTDNYQNTTDNLSQSPGVNNYTPIMIDLHDDFNQSIINGLPYAPLANDNVSGYNISQFQMAVFNSFSWLGVRDHLLYNNDNPTENNLVTLFNEW